MERAERAEKRGDYLTAQRELQKTLNVAPNSEEALAHMIIAAYKNTDLAAVYAAGKVLYGRKMDDTALVNRVNEVFDELQFYQADSALSVVLQKYKSGTVPDKLYKNFIRKNPDNIFAMFSLASLYSDQERYVKADSVLRRLLNMKDDFIPALNLRTMVKRELKQLDSSLVYCDAVLKMNHQYTYALSSKARTLLKGKKNIEGLKLAQQCYNLDQEDGYNISTLALAYHLNNDLKKRDHFIALAKKDSARAVYFQYVSDVINNKIQYQN